jgi:hypothetical protein
MQYRGWVLFARIGVDVRPGFTSSFVRTAFVLAVLLFTLAASAIPASARVWTVAADSSGDFFSVQDAIRAANGSGGDEIQILPGRYHEAVDTQGKSLILTGVGGAGSVVIDADAAGSALKALFTPGNLEIRNITFTEGIGTVFRAGDRYGRCGGGIILETSSPLIEDCRFTDNTAETGGGIFVIAGAPTFRRCIIDGNVASNGGGVYIDEDAGAVFENCDIKLNTSTFGGGFYAFNSRSAFNLCRIHNNDAFRGGAGLVLERGQTPFEINSSVLFRNSADEGCAIYCDHGSARFDHLTIANNSTVPLGAAFEITGDDVEISNSVIAFSGMPLRCSGGNVSAPCTIVWNTGQQSQCSVPTPLWRQDPLFCDRANDVYTVMSNSPCLPGFGPPGCGEIGAMGLGCYPADVEIPDHPSRTVRWGTLRGMFH